MKPAQTFAQWFVREPWALSPLALAVRLASASAVSWVIWGLSSSDITLDLPTLMLILVLGVCTMFVPMEVLPWLIDRSTADSDAKVGRATYWWVAAPSIAFAVGVFFLAPTDYRLVGLLLAVSSSLWIGTGYVIAYVTVGRTRDA